MKPHQPSGWNTWDYRGVNRLVFLRKGATAIVVQFAVWDEHVPPPAPDSRKIGRLHDSFRWSDVKRLGEHGALSLPATLSLTIGDSLYEASATVREGGLHLTVRPLGPSRCRVVFTLPVPFGEPLAVTGPHAGKFASFKIQLEGCAWPADYFLNIAEPYAVGQPGAAASIVVSPTRATDRKLALATPGPLPAGDGALADAPEAMMTAITWNTVYDPRRRLVSTPVSRDWSIDWKGPIVFDWDTYLVGLMSGCGSGELARYNFEAVSEPIKRLGFVPNYVMSHGATSLDRSMPPLGAYLVLKHERLAPDLPWLRTMYPLFVRWHRFWMKRRDGNRDGLLEWGSDPTPFYEFPELVPYNPSLRHEAICAKYESGLDNSPMFDEVTFNKETNTFELTDVTLNSYYAMDCEALASMATLLGKPTDAERYSREADTMRNRIDATLWDAEHELYANRHWDGRFSTRWSPTSFFPLIAGIADPARARRMVERHLLNEAEFWGPYVIPAIARSDPAFADNDYWRGRIWGPFNFLVAEGLRRYRFDDIAAELAKRGAEMFLRNWREDGGVYENYNAVTGAGADVWNAARLYHWGGLMAFVAIQELIDVETGGFLRLGSLDFPDAGVRDLRVGPHRFDVSLSGGPRGAGHPEQPALQVTRDGERFCGCTCRAIVRLPLAGNDTPIELSAAASGRLMLVRDATAARQVRLNGDRSLTIEETPGGLECRW